MTTYLYACTACDTLASDDTHNKTDAASPSAKHLATCAGSVVLTGTDEAALVRIVARVKEAAA